MAVSQSIWKMAFRNLANQNTTTILTVAAIAVCVMTFVSIFSILDGLQLTIQGVIEGYYGDRKVFVIASGSSDTFHESSIANSIADKFRSLPAVYALSEEVLVETTYEGVEVDLLGADIDDLSAVNFIQSLEGNTPESLDECIVGITAARTLGIDPGRSLNLILEDLELDLTVAGVFETKTPLDALIVVDRKYLSSEIPRFSSNSSIIRIRVVGSEELDAVTLYTQQFHPDLKINEARQVSQFFEKSIVNISRLLSTIIVFVILLMVMGIYNSMNMVVSERAREIGIIRAIGARRSFVLRLFVAESALLALLGGLFGVALGVAMSHAITSFFSIFVPGSPSVAPLTKVGTIGWGIVASLTIGLIGGIFPANRASKVEVSEALSEG